MKKLKASEKEELILCLNGKAIVVLSPQVGLILFISSFALALIDVLSYRRKN